MRTRILPMSEWGRLDATTRAMLGTMAPSDVAVLVVEREGEIVARMCVFRAVHWESFWMAPEVEGNAGVTRALLRAATAKAQRRIAQGSGTTVQDVNRLLKSYVEARKMMRQITGGGKKGKGKKRKTRAFFPF